MRVRHLAVLCTVALAAFALPALAEWYSDHQDKMGTRIDVQIWDDEEERARRLIAAAMAEFDRITERGGVLGAMETMYLSFGSLASNCCALRMASLTLSASSIEMSQFPSIVD